MTRAITKVSSRPNAEQINQACETYGGLKEGVFIAGYSLERAFQKLEVLLAGDAWRYVGTGFHDVNALLDSIQLASFRPLAEARKRIAKHIKELQPDAANRSIGNMLGVAHTTVGRDLGGAHAPAEPEKTQEDQNGGAAHGQATGFRRTPTYERVERLFNSLSAAEQRRFVEQMAARLDPVADDLAIPRFLQRDPESAP
jgi:hypothetical protein